MTTREACTATSVSHDALVRMIRTGRFTPPPKDAYGYYRWTAADVARLRKALAQRGRRQRGRRQRAAAAAE